jgi:hypothetical protein
MKVGKFYKITYTYRPTGTEESFIGMYEGIETEYTESIECAVCQREGHARVHQFNIPYHQTGNIEEMTEELDSLNYETLYFGTACIKKCKLEEL